MKLRVEWSELLIEKGKLDPLGLWRVGDRLVGELLSPFTTVVQQRPARYFPMYCWLLSEAGRGLSDKAKKEDFWERFNVLEGVFLCAAQLHNPHKYASYGGRIGSEHAGALLQSADAQGNIDFSVLRKRGIRNGWEVNYNGSMRDFGVTEIDYGVPGALKLSDDGKALAAAYERSIGDTKFLRQYRNTPRIPKTVIQELAQVACPCRLHDAATRELTEERRLVKQRLVRDLPAGTEKPGGALLQSLHLILDVLTTLAPSGINRARWNQILTTGMLPDGQRYQPPAACLETFRKWQLYALDLLCTFSFESALQGFLEELHSRDQLPRHKLVATFTGQLLARPDVTFSSHIETLRTLQDSKRQRHEEKTIKVIRESTAKHKVAAAFDLFCYSLATYAALKVNTEYAEALAFYDSRAHYDRQELALPQTFSATCDSSATVAEVFAKLFVSEWIVQRQLETRYQRNKELAWFSYNAETKTYDWEDRYTPTLYRASRLENLMGFLTNINVVKPENGGWRFVSGSLDEITP